MRVTPGVTRTSIVAGASPEAVRVDRFHYPPGGHTHWHLHTGEQVLYGESGRGWVQFDGQERARLDPGRVVPVPVGVRHWHGAVPDESLVHIAVTAGGDTEWLGELTLEEYAGDAEDDRSVAPEPDPDGLVRAFMAALERRDVDSALAYVSDDVVYDNVAVGSVTGPTAVRAALAGVIDGSEQVQRVINHQVGRDDVVMNERTDRFLVDGRWIEMPVAGLFVLVKGRIALWRDYVDLETRRRPRGAS
jgi:limonene-1,2-epoxide hydrolase/quercetin dioxygenase-like cupin family protein